jgi:hypothetical protein
MAARRARGVRLTREERLEVRRLIENGSSFEQAAVAARCSRKTVQRVLGSVGGMPARGRARAKLRLSLAERDQPIVITGESNRRQVLMGKFMPKSFIRKQAMKRRRSRMRYK